MLTPKSAVSSMLKVMAPRKTTTNGQFKRQAQQEDGPGQAEVGPHHEDVAVGEVDHGEDAVNHGVAQGDEGVDAPQLQGVQDILGQELEHRVIPWKVQGSKFKVRLIKNMYRAP